MNKTFSTELFNQMPIVGIMRNMPAAHLQGIAKTWCDSGLTCLEITMNSEGAEAGIAHLAAIYAGKLNIGAGTVCSMADLERALNAGAQFIVTPIINEEVIRACVNTGVPIFPGAFTPSEIYKAWSLGATMVKLFPAGDLKPTYVKEVLAPLSQIKILPTGGIGLENFTSWLAMGAKGVGVGSQLFPRDVIQREDWTELGNIYREFVEKYQEFSATK